jgi:hypothetical protein
VVRRQPAGAVNVYLPRLTRGIDVRLSYDLMSDRNFIDGKCGKIDVVLADSTD